MKYKILIYIVLAHLLFGCASGVKFATPAPINDNNSRLFVFRPTSPPILLKPTIYINDINIGELSSNGYYDFILKPGIYSIRSIWGLLSGVVPGDKTITIDAKPNDIMYVMVSSSGKVHGMYTPGLAGSMIGVVDAATAQPIISNCELIGKYSGANNVFISK